MDNQSTGGVKWPQDTWRLRLRLNVPSLEPPVVQYGVFSEDPRGRYSSDLKRVNQVFQQKLAETDNQERRKALRWIQLAGVWTHLFRNLRGDEVYLLVAPGSGTALMSNALAEAKWLVTKPVRVNGRPFCWSVPFEAIHGQEVEITLTQENALDLDALEESSRL